MDALTHAKTVLKRYPSLAWLPETTDGFQWREERGTVTITPEPGTAIAEKWGHYFPVIVTPSERVELPAFDVRSYPSPHQREHLAQGKPTAMAMLCNRFYRATGHSFLYLHYPEHPLDDKIINFNAGKNSLGKLGMRRDVDFVHHAADGVIDPELRGVTSFAGFPITDMQAKVIEADAILAMSNPDYIRYSLLNQGANALNCVGFALNRLQNANEPLGQLTGKHHVRRALDNDCLPDYHLTTPGSVHKDVRARISESIDRTTLHIHHAGDARGKHDAELLLARSPDGLLLGETRSITRPMPGKDQYLAHDIVALADHLFPAVLQPDKAEPRTLAEVKLPTFESAPVNTQRVALLGGSI